MLRRTCALVSIAFALSLFAATGAATTAKRTFVASTGNDANPCSLTAPCRDFARAIMQTSIGGEVIVLDSAGYGAVTVTKSVSIIAPPGIYAGISVFSGDGVTVNAPGATVVLRGLSINGQGGNQRHLAAGGGAAAGRELRRLGHARRRHLAHRRRPRRRADRARHRRPRQPRLAASTLFANIGSLVLDHVRSEHNGGNGVSITPSVGSIGALATITDSVFTHNEGDGIGADSVAGATITLVVERSVISNNGQNGFRADVQRGLRESSR